ncbi:hypothetical protein EBT16_14485 [bacterium]|nr:hypothetical protein [bacterium]
MKQRGVKITYLRKINSTSWVRSKNPELRLPKGPNSTSNDEDDLEEGHVPEDGYVGKAFHNFFKGHYDVKIYDPALANSSTKDDINKCDLAVICVYVPNGQEVGSDKFKYKLKWFEKLKTFLITELSPTGSVLICGDFNVAPQDEDVYDPKAWKDQILFSEPEKAALQSIRDLGFLDLYREIRPNQEGFTWWDYRNVSFPKNHGLRIDFILGSKTTAEHLEDSYVDRNERKGEQPSDHAPVVCVFKTELLRNQTHSQRAR